MSTINYNRNTQGQQITISLLPIENGWIDPDKTKVKPYLTVKDTRTLQKGLVSKDLPAAIPFSLSSEILNIFH